MTPSPTFKLNSLIGKQMSIRLRFGPIILHLIEIQKSPEDIVLIKRQTEGTGVWGFCRTTCVVFPWWKNPTTSASKLADMQSCHAD